MTTNKLQSTRYDVSRWTAFTWADDSTAEERDPFISRAAAVVGRELERLCPKYAPLVELCRVNGKPQLKVTLRLPADDPEQALERLDYYITRALTAKAARVPTGPRERVQLRPPWGREEVTEVA